MKLRRTLRPSLRALFAHRLRATLALSSVAVGVAAVVLTSAIGDGAQRDVMRRVESMGTNLLIVRPAQVERLASRKAIRGSVTTLDLEDFDAITHLPLVADAAPSVDRPLRVKAAQRRARLQPAPRGAGGGGRAKESAGSPAPRALPPAFGNGIATVTNVRGTTPSFMRVRRFALSEGTFFEENDSRRVAVLGSSVAEALDVGVGDEIRVRGVPFDVIGILAPRGVAADGSDEDNQLLVPLRTAMRRVFNTTWLNTIFISVRDPEQMEDARAEVTRLLRARHGREDFGVQNTARMMSMQQQVADSLTMFGTGLGALALLVGGTGILALMMMSVRERTGEIGLRIAVGATPRDILAQFLIEATLLALGGWLAGLAIGALGAAAVALATKWSTALPTRALVASAVMVLIAGLGFGSVPARKASRLPPIEALRA